ncbi:fimbrial protein [Stenotrophomonas hibiscicola]|uniref:fimbrial protein n=1 Tax=Stenotrophomonas hibiscicola TaxID=86189 RepID=UPI001661545F|nr:type 1 fimbrial protein [[Pseudomonas] hibiscicola]
MNKLAIALTAALSLGAAASASAADGTITFTGKIVAATCKVEIGDGGGSTATVALPDVTVGAVDGPDAGKRTFKIKLSADAGSGAACDKDTAKLYVYKSTVNANGHLANQYTDAVDDPASDVALKLSRIESGAETEINLQTAELEATKAAGAFEYEFATRYQATAAAGATKAGGFTSQLMFDVENY